MCDNGDLEDKPPAPPVRMSSTIFSGGGKDTLAANHSSKPLPSVPEERKRNKIISIFSGAEKGAYRSLHTPHPAASGSSRSRESRQTPEIHLPTDLCANIAAFFKRLFFVICILFINLFVSYTGLLSKTKLEKYLLLEIKFQ